MVATRPSIILDPEWAAIEPGKQTLAEILPEGSDIDLLVQQQPLLVVGDLQAAAEEAEKADPRL